MSEIWRTCVLAPPSQEWGDIWRQGRFESEEGQRWYHGWRALVLAWPDAFLGVQSVRNMEAHSRHGRWTYSVYPSQLFCIFFLGHLGSAAVYNTALPSLKGAT